MRTLSYFYLALLVFSVFLSTTIVQGQTCLRSPNPTCSSTSITPCLENTTCNPQATYIGKPYIYDGECTIGITRYLSRSVEMNFLADFNYPSPCWNLYADPNTPLPPNQTSVNCYAPYNKCGSFYCPDKYCALVKSLVALDAQFVQHAYSGVAYQEDKFFPGEAWYCLGSQVVRDINYVYDCAGKRRPIIQATMGEVIDPHNFDNMSVWNDGVDRHIPPTVISKYFEYFGEDQYSIDPQSGMTYAAYYATPRYFKRDRITSPGPDGDRADITLVEMRMWFLYQAMTLLDFGYTALHMGIYWNYAAKEKPGNTNGLPVYHLLDKLTSAIREYASSCGDAGFVLLSGEPPMNELSAKAGGTDRFIFDFDSRAMRPREISNPSVSGLDTGCSDPISQSIIEAYKNSPCGSGTTATPLPAVVDPCVITAFGGTSGGTSPLGCHYDQIPYTVHFDGFAGVNAHPGVASNGDLTWGYDDHRWFEQLSPECKKWWFDYFYCNRREFNNGVGFLIVPGIINMNYLEVNDIPGPAHSDGKWLISDDPSMIASIANGALHVNANPTLVITEHCTTPNDCKASCSGQPLPPTYLWRSAGKYYKIQVGNKDCSSIYSIHMKDPSGNWLPQVIGSETDFYPPVAGNYQISIRQDNLALPPSTFGTNQLPFTTRYMETECCQVVLAKDCRREFAKVSVTHASNISDVYTYDLVIETTDDLSGILNVRPVDTYSKVASIQFITPQKTKVVFVTTANDHPTLRILADVLQGDSTIETLLTSDLPIERSFGKLNNSTGSEIQPFVDMKLFPNPVENTLQVQLTSSSTILAKVVVFNSLSAIQLSKEVTLTQGDNNLSVDMTTLPAGVYSISVYTPEISSNAKFVKVKR